MSGALGDLTGQIIGGRYRLGTMLGQGGMGVVYVATQESLARPVALKVLQPMLAQSGESVARFRAEAERAGRLAHPHIVQILDFGQEPGGSAWIAMELLHGESLGQRIARGPMSEAEVARIVLQTLAALEAAHSERIVHRDLKPDNIFLAEIPGIGTSVKVLDFGIAKLLDDEAAGKLTATGMLIGTPLYMAPEQARGMELDQRADLYSLGAVMYEALTGRPPFEAKNYNALLYAVLSEEPPLMESRRPDVSRALLHVVTRAMSKDPGARYQSARDMAEALRSVSPSSFVPASWSPAAPADALGDTTPVLGGPSTPNASHRTAPSGPPRTTPATRATPAGFPENAPLGRTTTKADPGFRWWPIALAGGALAMATLAFVGSSALSSRDESSVAVASPGAQETPPAFVQPMLPSTLPTEAPPPSPPGRGPVSPVDNSQPTPTPGPTEVHTGAHGHLVDGRDPRPEDPLPPANPRPRTVPRPSVRPSGGTLPGYSMSALGPTLAAIEPATCWPRGVPAPVVNRGRDFLLDVAGDGSITSVQVAPNNEDPVAFSSCIVSRLRTRSFPPPEGGTPTHIRIGFHIEGPY